MARPSFYRFVIALLVCLVAGPQAALSQVEFSNLPAPGVPVFDLDWAVFRHSADSARVECYYRITNPRLSYVRRNLKPSEVTGSEPTADTSQLREYYVAAYEMTAILSSAKDKQAATVSTRENYALPTFEETRNPSGYLINILSVSVPIDDYDLEVTLTDRVANTIYSVKRNLLLHSTYGDGWSIGGPMFFDPVAAAPESPRFDKRDHRLVPNVGRSLARGGDRLAMYLEIYLDESPDASSLVVHVDQRFGKKKLADTVTISGEGPVIPLLYKNPLVGFASGESEIRLSLIDAKGKTIGSPLEIPFWIDWSTSGLVEQDWKEAVDMLVHIATHDELKKLRDAPEDGREKAFADFWKSKDPTPGSEENEWEDEYYRRIRHADLHFTTAFQRGWRTDFGTVYVKYGEPDEIERHPFERGTKPYQIWSYYGQRRRFVFIDVNGNGDYRLQYPYDGLIR